MGAQFSTCCCPKSASVADSNMATKTIVVRRGSKNYRFTVNRTPSPQFGQVSYAAVKQREPAPGAWVGPSDM
jgi:hypothetical protein